ncbi:hypothetical protein SKAU_G00056300 [Synaphobranchus kaupii]|uniref:Uncharacterized protein n=1 Tax=Synaphobranchus kaupii TaxID=118154 RepID=A0A9Q1G5E0_SYNKA|nr:hypothetical protein SKAU_G00056300 [Synaphobranchus kaupii]
MRERLLREKKLTLDTCVQLCRAAELSRENIKAISRPMVEEVHALQGAARQRQSSNIVDCKFCGKMHEKSKQKCPAYAETEKVNAVDSDKVNDTQLFAGMLLGKDVIKFQIDCGATCNVIPINLLNPVTELDDTKTVLVMYNKIKLRPLGKCKVKLRNPRNHKLYQLEFQVVDKDCTVPLLGKKASEAMKLIKVHYENIMAIVTSEKPTGGQWTMGQIQAEYADVFTGDGCLEGEYTIEVDNTVKPVQLPKRRVPVAMMKPLKDELQDLQRRGIITPVECSTDWISGMVVVQKQNGKLRVH